MTLILKKGETIADDQGRNLQVTEITPIGDAYVVVQFYIVGSRQQVDISNPNPPDTPGNPEPEPTPEQLAESKAIAERFNR